MFTEAAALWLACSRFPALSAILAFHVDQTFLELLFQTGCPWARQCAVDLNATQSHTILMNCRKRTASQERQWGAVGTPALPVRRAGTRMGVIPCGSNGGVFWTGVPQRRRSYAQFFLLGLLSLFLCGFGPPTLMDRDIAPAQRLTVGQLRQMQRVRTRPADTSAVAVLAFDVDSQQVLMTQAADLPIPPASLTKLMTALLVFEQNRLSEQVTIHPQDLVGESTMGLEAGEVLSVEELLWGLLVPSGNDAAMALARHHAGQVPVFVQQMNLRARELNLLGTQFANPNGFDAEGQVSSAQDLLALVRLLWEYPLFREIVGTASTTVASHPLETTNRLLGFYPEANGVKTGTTRAAGQSLIAGVDLNGHQLFAVVLGSADRYYDTQTVFETVRRNYRWVALSLPERPTVLDRIFDSAGNRWFLRAEGNGPDLLLAGWERQRLRPFRRVQPQLSDFWIAGMEVGTLEWRFGDVVVATQQLVVR